MDFLDDLPEILGDFGKLSLEVAKNGLDLLRWCLPEDSAWAYLCGMVSFVALRLVLKRVQTWYQRRENSVLFWAFYDQCHRAKTIAARNIFVKPEIETIVDFAKMLHQILDQINASPKLRRLFLRAMNSSIDSTLVERPLPPVYAERYRHPQP